ncbi:suppressor of fused domain protein [Lysobacter gummosus]|uniref:Suppressor of fused domain protein n=1 Tax=Lysobacter gummosus TaxID=262324 RepID=A0ABY3XGV4_9GAMM|nr:suppressor of fused domain protein [Lysobacter gummosus]ALN90308.1 suppressor of fused family protein [Lysobacter gummosus]UNP30849.1 suppressor of fused domain protein [Lysobacter gummosus]
MRQSETEHSTAEDRAPGWDAINHALNRIYPRQEPKHYGTLIGLALGGADPLPGISAYKRITPVPHWHFVTYGFSELYEKQSDDPQLSGYGFELTLRLSDPDDSEEPPAWALNFLQNLARYVFDSGHPFHAGHYLNTNGPIAADSDTAIRSVAFAHDPELSAIDSENGRVEFLQVIGLTNEEEFALKRWSTLKVLDVFKDYLPLWVTDLERGSLLADSDVAARLAEGSAREGSSVGMIYTDQLSWEQRKRLLRRPLTQISIGARQVGELLALLPLRLPFGHAFTVVGPDARIVFEPAARNSAEAIDGALHLRLDDRAMRSLVARLRAQAGEYEVEGFPSLLLQVQKTEIRAQDGSVEQVIG